MVWTEITRLRYGREGMRYESDMTDGEWLVMEPLLPPPSALGRPRETDMRALVNAMYRARFFGHKFDLSGVLHGGLLPGETRLTRAA